jgi:DNA polymerase-3 subunit alpha
MAFIKIMDFTGSIEAVVFPKAFVNLADILVPEACVAISGKVSVRNGEKSIVIEKAKKIEV